MYVLRENKPREVICTLVSDGNGNFRAIREDGSTLGIFTKSQVIHGAQGFQRSNDFILQDQSAKLLPKERVCNCLKNALIKLNLVKLNITKAEKKHIMGMFNSALQFGLVLYALKESQKTVEEELKGLETWKNVHRGSVMLLTLTFSHSQSESLKSLLERKERHIKFFLKQPR